MKGQALANFLKNHPILETCDFSKDLPNEDVLFIESSQP